MLPEATVSLAHQVSSWNHTSARVTMTPPSTFDEFYLETYESVLRLACTLVSTRSQAEDLTQEAFLSTYAKYAHINSPHTYVRRSLFNLAVGTYRRTAVAARKAPLLQQEAAAAEAMQSGTSNVTDLQQDLLRALDELPDRQRAALILRHFEQCSEAEIAEILDCRKGTVKSLLSRGTAALREVWDR